MVVSLPNKTYKNQPESKRSSKVPPVS